MPPELDTCSAGISGTLAPGGSDVEPEVATASAVLLHSSPVTNDTNGAGERDPQAIFYHGTDPASALLLVNGDALSLEAALTMRANSASAPGFYLATDPDVAMYFASSHNKGVTTLRYAMTTAALTSLLAGRAVRGPVPRGAAIGSFPGSQLLVVPAQFGRVNALLRDGSIAVHPYKFTR
jgi:hypothetical protein